jgi:hypothetical protein
MSACACRQTPCHLEAGSSARARGFLLRDGPPSSPACCAPAARACACCRSADRSSIVDRRKHALCFKPCLTSALPRWRAGARQRERACGESERERERARARARAPSDERRARAPSEPPPSRLRAATRRRQCRGAVGRLSRGASQAVAVLEQPSASSVANSSQECRYCHLSTTRRRPTQPLHKGARALSARAARRRHRRGAGEEGEEERQVGGRRHRARRERSRRPVLRRRRRCRLRGAPRRARRATGPAAPRAASGVRRRGAAQRRSSSSSTILHWQ